jgi:uncharacterized protein (TIGR03089 family)
VPAPNDTPSALLGAMVRSDPTRPRLTWYDDLAGPTQGERIELSGRVLANWTAKAANLLQEDLDVGPGSAVALDLPPHWRTAYWLLAIWSVGAEAVVGPPQGAGAPDVLVTDGSGGADGPGASAGQVVAVTLAALARAWAGPPLPTGAIDEARELATYGDRFEAWSTPAPGDPALTTAGRTYSYADLVPAARAAAAAAGLVEQARVMTSAAPRSVLECWLPAWSVDGSLVLVRPPQTGPDELTTAARVTAERVTDQL